MEGVFSMNIHMKTQINQVLLSVQVFEDSLKLAAQKDDGVISKEEQKIINKIQKASAKYVKALKKIEGES